MNDAASRIIADAIAAHVFPAAAIEVGTSGGSLRSDALGTLTFDPSSPATTIDTVFDLASLTKPIATTSIVMSLVRAGALRLDAPVEEFFGEWRGVDREQVTVRDLLAHASGLPVRLVDAPPDTRREFEHEICTIRLEYQPRTQSIYSDLGFILLGFLVADIGGAPLSELFDRITVRLQTDLTFGVAPALRHLAAPTLPMADDARRGRRLIGEVHDNYAAALGGVAGHAGLFGTAPAVAAFARVVLRAARLKGSRSTFTEGSRSSVEGARGFQPSDAAPFSPELVQLFTTRSTVPGSSRALGWDTMLPTSSCGERMSPQAFGQVGFTGTSLWIDPVRDRYFVLLTNRVCGGGTLDEMRAVRRAFHDALSDT